TRGSRPGLTSRDRLEAEPLSFHQRIRVGYLALAREEPERIRVMNAAMSMHEIEAAVRDEVGRLKGSQF
ncbi:MAG: hypothetical protein AABY63_04510, partial [candidate division NC10 bacterium]